LRTVSAESVARTGARAITVDAIGYPGRVDAGRSVPGYSNGIRAGRGPGFSTCRRTKLMTIAMASAVPQAGAEIFERILTAPSGLVVLQSKDAEALIEQVRVLARHSGQAVYLWQPDTGLGSLREAHARVPDCERLGNALRYMQQSMHFGVYFVRGVELPLSAVDAALLRQLARAPKGHLRRVVLVDAPPALAAHLGDLAAQVSTEDGKPRQLRLRDGRWLT